MGLLGPTHDRAVAGRRFGLRAALAGSTRRRRCSACAVNWSAAARFCGICGLPLDPVGAGRGAGDDDPASPSNRDQGATADARTRRSRRRVLSRIAAVALIAVVWSQAGTYLDRFAISSPMEWTVDVEVGGDDLGTAAQPRVTCLRSGEVAGTCGPVLVDGGGSRAVVTPLSSDAVVLGASGEVARVDLPSGAVRWRTLAFAGARQLTLHADEERVLATIVGAVATIDAQTGRLLWRRHLDTAVAGVSDDARVDEGPPDVDATTPFRPEAPARAWWVGEDVLVLDHLDVLHALDGATGATLWAEPDVGNQAIATSEGVVTARWNLVAAWRPEDPAPEWQHVDQGLRPGRIPYGTVVDGPLPLSPWRRLMDPATGELLDLPRDGPSITYVTGAVTLILQWPGGDAGLEVTAMEAGANVRWRRTGLPVPCCLTSAVPASDGRIALTTPAEPTLLLDLADGATLSTFERDSGRLEAVVGDLAVWRTADGLIGEDLAGGSEAFRAHGTLLSIEPLLIDGPSGVVAVSTTPGAAFAPAGMDTR